MTYKYVALYYFPNMCLKVLFRNVIFNPLKIILKVLKTTKAIEKSLVTMF
jgi:hypothetical protein